MSLTSVNANLKILCITHSDFDLGPHIASWIKNQQHTLTYCRPFQGQSFPSLDEFDWLILTGGTQCLLEKKQYTFLLDEIDFVKRAIASNKIVLGFCLGAQIIGESYGQETELSPYQEVGAFPIELTLAGKNDPILKDLPQSLTVAHWHKYMPGITKTATILATSAGCPRQIIRYSPKTYGFQCHPELCLQDVEKAISLFYEQLPAGPYIQAKEEFLGSDFSSMNHIVVLILNRLAQLKNSK